MRKGVTNEQLKKILSLLSVFSTLLSYSASAKASLQYNLYQTNRFETGYSFQIHTIGSLALPQSSSQGPGTCNPPFSGSPFSLGGLRLQPTIICTGRSLSPSGMTRYSISSIYETNASVNLFSSLNGGRGIRTTLSSHQGYFEIESTYTSGDAISSMVGLFNGFGFAEQNIPLGTLATWTVQGTGDIISLNAVSGPPPGTSRANPFLPTQPQSSSESWVFQPAIVTDPSQVFWFDPEVTVGYIYSVKDSSGPLFDEFIAPDLVFNDTYELFVSANNTCSTNSDDYLLKLATITQDLPFNFSSPVQCFAIKGIDIRNSLDPINTTAFLAGIGFDATGTVSVRQTPIPATATAPVPAPLPIMGVIALFKTRKWLRRRHVSANKLRASS